MGGASHPCMVREFLTKCGSSALPLRTQRLRGLLFWSHEPASGLVQAQRPAPLGARHLTPRDWSWISAPNPEPRIPNPESRILQPPFPTLAWPRSVEPAAAPADRSAAVTLGAQ